MVATTHADYSIIQASQITAFYGAITALDKDKDIYFSTTIHFNTKKRRYI